MSLFPLLPAVSMRCSILFALVAVFFALFATLPAEATAVAAVDRPNGLCDVCTYAVENKLRRQPYLCRGLKDANYQKYCVQVLDSLLWWVENEVYWVNYGCERDNNGVKEWVRPCPAAAICSWLQDFETKTSFCNPDPMYPKPE